MQSFGETYSEPSRAVAPPSTINVVPVTNSASFPTRNDTAPATSAGVPSRPSAVLLVSTSIRASVDSSAQRANPSRSFAESIAPGATALTRILGPRSSAAERTQPSSAAFDVAYAVSPPVVARACTLPIATTDPLFRARFSSNVEIKASIATTLTRKISDHWASEVAPAVLDAEQQRIDVIRRASVAAVAIFAGEAGGGSGVLISPEGYALTNFHVVQPAGVAMKCGLSDGRLYDAVLVGLDPTGDVSLVKLLGRDDFPYAELADSD